MKIFLLCYRKMIKQLKLTLQASAELWIRGHPTSHTWVSRNSHIHSQHSRGANQDYVLSFLFKNILPGHFQIIMWLSSYLRFDKLKIFLEEIFCWLPVAGASLVQTAEIQSSTLCSIQSFLPPVNTFRQKYLSTKIWLKNISATKNVLMTTRNKDWGM